MSNAAWNGSKPCKTGPKHRVRISHSQRLTFPNAGLIIPEMGNNSVSDTANDSAKVAYVTQRPAATQPAATDTSIADALFSGVQQRVIGLLFGEPERSFYSNEIVRRVASGRGALQRELERLTQAGLVTVNLSGRQKYFQANPNSPIFNEICAIVRKTFGLTLVLKQALTSVPGSVYWAFIYGSVAKGSDTAGSDIDLMVVADGLSYSVLFEHLAPVEQQLGRKINPTLYTAAEFQTRRLRDNHFLKRVLEQTPIELQGTLHDIPQPDNGTPAESGKDQADQI